MCKQSITIPLTRGKVAIIDADDLERIGSLRWQTRPDRYTFYAQRSETAPDGKRRTVHMHRLIMNAPSGVPVDHINGNGLDNRKANLRLCSRSQNASASHFRTHNTSGFRGVSYQKDCGLWKAYITYQGRRIHLGMFSTAEEASVVRDAKARELFGLFARGSAEDAKSQ